MLAKKLGHGRRPVVVEKPEQTPEYHSPAELGLGRQDHCRVLTQIRVASGRMDAPGPWHRKTRGVGWGKLWVLFLNR